MKQMQEQGQTKLHVGIFTDTYSPSINGVVTSIKGLAKGLRELGHEVTIVCPYHPKQQPEAGVVRLRSIDYPAQPEQRMALPPSLRRLYQLRKLKFDVIHTHGIHVPVFGLVFARALGLPLVFTYHTRMRDYIHYYPWYASIAWLTDEERWYLGRSRSETGAKISERLHESLDDNTAAFSERFDVWYANRCNELITPAEPMAEELKFMGVESPITVVHNGLDLQKLVYEPHDPYLALGVATDVPRLLSVGRLGVEKSFDELLRRFQLIHAAKPNAKLVLLGDGPEREHLEHLANNLGLKDAVVFVGYVAPEAVAGFYHHASLFVFASTSEVHPMVGLEAAACGLPIVARAKMGITRCVVNEQTGFLVDPDDMQVFCDRVLELLNDDAKRHAFSQESKAWSAREWGHKRMAERTLAVYQRAVNDYVEVDEELKLAPDDSARGALPSLRRLGRAAQRALAKRGLL